MSRTLADAPRAGQPPPENSLLWNDKQRGYRAPPCIASAPTLEPHCGPACPGPCAPSQAAAVDASAGRFDERHARIA
jgi:hypothetical protein